MAAEKLLPLALHLAFNLYSSNDKTSNNACYPFKFLLEYKLLQEHTITLLNKIRQSSWWIIIQMYYNFTMSWEEQLKQYSGNCISFDDVLCEFFGFLDPSSKRRQHPPITNIPEMSDNEAINYEMLIMLDQKDQNGLCDVLFYICGYIAKMLYLIEL